MTPISFQNIGKVIDFLVKKRGIRYIDTPWVIPSYVKNLTYKGSDSNVLSTGLSLVGSAEQGFIYLQLQDALENNYVYISCTPCFRNESEISDTHRAYFMKAELFMPLPVTGIGYPFLHIKHPMPKIAFIVNTAKICLESIFGISLEAVKIDEWSYDLNLNGIEIGSYYYRNYTIEDRTISYVCGTAIAEPRFSIALGKCSG